MSNDYPHGVGTIYVFSCTDEYCRKRMVTQQRDSGTVPFTIRCKTCGGGHARVSLASSAEDFAAKALHLTLGAPKYEWYKPSAAALLTYDGEMQRYIADGGLEMREISELWTWT